VGRVPEKKKTFWVRPLKVKHLEIQVKNAPEFGQTKVEWNIPQTRAGTKKKGVVMCGGGKRSAIVVKKGVESGVRSENRGTPGFVTGRQRTKPQRKS